jgi:hypothetical protein
LFPAALKSEKMSQAVDDLVTEEKDHSTKPVAPSSTTRAELERLVGREPVQTNMIRYGHPLTVETYVSLNWSGKLPDREENPEAIGWYEELVLKALEAHEAALGSIEEET